MASLPSFVIAAQQERQEAAFRAECADRARAYSYRVRARRAYRIQMRLVALAVVTTVGTAVFVSWQIASVVTWLLNN